MKFLTILAVVSSLTCALGQITTTRTPTTVLPTTTRTPTTSVPGSTVTPTLPTSTVTATPPTSSIPTVTSTLPTLPTSSTLTVTPTLPTSSTSIPPTPTPSTPVVNTTVSYDTVYDNRAGSLSWVACSDGPNGLLTKGFTTFGSLPKFPLIGGAFAVAGWNSPNCGTCWELAYARNGTTTRINVLAIDVAVNSFNIALAGLNQLTGGQGVQLGRVNVQARQVSASLCGL
ncbi:hypothetical protein H1R20_g10749, partial [Candolleomyces eurysporus]